jgi:hypothetical protein
MNLYAYIGDDPINMTDPGGLWSCWGSGTFADSSFGYTCGNGWSSGYDASAVVLSNPLLKSTLPPPCALVDPTSCAGLVTLALPPQNVTRCPGAGGNGFSNGVDAIANTNAYILTGTAATLEQSGQRSDAAALTKFSRPLGVGLIGVSEGYGTVSDIRAGMSWQRATLIHGAGAGFSWAGAEAGAVGGARVGFVIGEIVAPEGGGAVGAPIGAIVGAIGGGWGGNKLGHAAGGVVAAKLGHCR